MLPRMVRTCYNGRAIPVFQKILSRHDPDMIKNCTLSAVVHFTCILPRMVH